MAKARAPVRSANDALLRPPLLTTKLYLPPACSQLVPRPRLLERLNAGVTRRLTLISAPAGFGKTTLLSAWIPQSPRCVAWVSLDEGDNDPTRFWSYFISAVQMLDGQLGQNALRFRRLFTMHIGVTPGEIRRAGIQLGDKRKNRPSAA